MIDFVSVRTSDLVGPALNWAVETAIGGAPELVHSGSPCDESSGWMAVRRKCGSVANHEAEFLRLDFTTSWVHGGPLIDFFHISFREFAPGRVTASVNKYPFRGAWSRSDWKAGPTRLIAACRAIVADLLGDSVLVPKELVNPIQA